MSYILDALKKSEAERDPTAAAALVIAEAERTQAQRRKYRAALWVIGVALLVNAAVFGVWLGRTSTDGNPTSVETVAADAPTGTAESTRGEPATGTQDADTTPVAAVGAGATPVTEPSGAEAASAGPDAAQTPATEAPVERATPLRRATLATLPEPLRSAFPGLVFSTHVYADDPELRAVVVNGTRRTEGEFVEGMQIDQISEVGVVFRYDDYLVEISVLETWEE